MGAPSQLESGLVVDPGLAVDSGHRTVDVAGPDPAAGKWRVLRRARGMLELEAFGAGTEEGILAQRIRTGNTPK